MSYNSFNEELDALDQSESSNQESNRFSNNQQNKYPNKGGYNKGYNGGNKKWDNNRKWVKKEEEDPNLFELYKPYVITGNKETPANVIDLMKRLVVDLEANGFTTRTGGLEGPDQAIEEIAKKHELYLPWQGFNNKESKFYFNTPRSLVAASRFHPAFDGLSSPVKAFLSKNARMVLGDKLNSSGIFLICWSDDGVETAKERTVRTGNIGHVIAIADAMKMPIFNLGKADAEQRLRAYLSL